MIYFVRRAYVVDPPITGTREIERLLERSLTRLPDIDCARVFAKIVGDAITGIVIEVGAQAHDEAAASKQGRGAIRTAMRQVGVSRWDVRLTDGLTSAAPLPIGLAGNSGAFGSGASG